MCLQLSEELGLQLTRLELVSHPRLVSVFEVGPFHPMILRGLRSQKTHLDIWNRVNLRKFRVFPATEIIHVTLLNLTSDWPGGNMYVLVDHLLDVCKDFDEANLSADE